MRSDLSIKVDGLSKAYRIGTRRAAAPLVRAVSALRREAASDTDSRYWALDDVSFSAAPGEVVGIVGRNGAGKSTLLKILSRITEPTRGSADLYGRVGCLLEVGTGFHQELTGMENIFLNGSILGMRRSEIRARLDEIVEFSGVERFLDTPVKRYSSGMYVRLAFAVAAHLEPEILIVDEVLAVGDIEFQRKCLGKMQSVATESGRTVLFVSHNSATVRSLCTRGLVFGKGRLIFDGDVDEALEFYTRTFDDHSVSDGTFVLTDRLNPLGSSAPITLSSLVIEGDGGPTAVLRPQEPVRLVIRTVVGTEARNPYYRIHIRNNLDQHVLSTDSRMAGGHITDEGAVFEFDRLPLLPGTYFVDVGMGFGRGTHVLDYVADAGRFEVRGHAPYSPDYELLREDGHLVVEPKWRPLGAEAGLGAGAADPDRLSGG